jgi:GNAT superfamily N-acetyltransferase
MPTNLNIKPIDFKYIEPYKKSALKSGLTFCAKTNYYGLFKENELMAFTGVLISSEKIIFKNHYVLPNYRGNGYFKMLLDFSIELSRILNVKKIEATCTDMSIKEYLKRGFRQEKKYKKYTKVVHENIQ